MLLVGINGGGKASEAVLFNETGKIEKLIRGESTSQISEEESVAFDHLENVITKVTEGCSKDKIACVFAGISGSLENEKRHAAIQTFISGMFPDKTKTEVSNDAVNAFRSIAPQGDGIVANVSTGSSVFYISGSCIGQIGGWGYQFGDEGSAYDLGKRAIISALRQKDGRGSATMMTAILEEKLGGSVSNKLQTIYSSGRIMIASFADIVLEAAVKNDIVACKQLEESARSIAEMIRTASGKVKCSLSRVALSGYMWKNKLYYSYVDQLVGRTCQLIIPQRPKVYGAAVQALIRAGFTWSSSFDRIFQTVMTN